MSSLAFWIFCQAPQFIKNWKRGNAEALSVWFLLEWLGGDISNMIGCLLTRQIPTQTYTAILFVCMDAVMISQYVVLGIKNRGKPPASISDDEDGSDAGDSDGADYIAAPSPVSEHTALLGSTDAAAADHRSLAIVPTAAAAAGRSMDIDRSPVPEESQPVQRQHGSARSLPSRGSLVMAASLVCTGLAMAAITQWQADAPDPAALHLHSAPRQLHELPLPAEGQLGMPTTAAAAAELPAWNATAGWSPSMPAFHRRLALDPCVPPNNSSGVSPGAETAGTVLGYISSLLYLNSRLPQIVQNCRRGTVVGLSWVMFFCAFMGNLTTASAIFMRVDHWSELKGEAPFLPGIVGTLMFDLFIISQYFVYTRRSQQRRARRARMRETLGPSSRNDDKIVKLLEDTPALPRRATHGLHNIVVDAASTPDLHAHSVPPVLPSEPQLARMRAQEWVRSLLRR